ncbi:MAG: bifunctional demethylmenaquinone methyltransferase/2-methoxy-6-polyprenyl-1,4-benzoquinol methylase UbiE [Armatimonadota bacterium]|nr:bifunctional demethylmenaquinone methyltransferase/2-methoxy-6-polyprenyl-1,4-benzoquinol methylase UbiE [Armatimonadota bacterium]MDR5697092.1 bifunctional demethylmenaquinone methyltransferase/2-methoxy-6-polyprenyl-1,4-benzoquinol methylase UbiE [Armatimonadota bacterium]
MALDAGKGALPPERKRAYVREMFSEIARHYDLLNNLLSFGLHRRWKRHAARLARLVPGGRALDVCCGTGDLAVLLHERIGAEGRAVGIDFAAPMVQIARQRSGGRGRIWFVQGDAESLPLPDAAFDAVTVGFGVRNVARLDVALRELHRVLRPGGRAVILEFSRPRNALFRALYDFYSYTAIPWVGRRLSHHPDAYLYLPTSIRHWPNQEAFARILAAVGFTHVRYENLLWGAVAVHVGEKGTVPGEVQETKAHPENKTQGRLADRGVP